MTHAHPTLIDSPVEPIRIDRLSSNTGPTPDALPACFILSIFGGFVPALLWPSTIVPSLIGVAAGIVIGVVMAYTGEGRADQASFSQ
jgi:hypothetical protein